MIPFLPAPAIDQITWTGPGDASTAHDCALGGNHPRRRAGGSPAKAMAGVLPRAMVAAPSAKRLANAGVAVAGAARRHA